MATCTCPSRLRDRIAQTFTTNRVMVWDLGIQQHKPSGETVILTSIERYRDVAVHMERLMSSEDSVSLQELLQGGGLLCQIHMSSTPAPCQILGTR